MAVVEASVLGRAGNCALVQLTDRKFPGLLIQGDTIRNLGEVVKELSENLESGNRDDAQFALMEVRETVEMFIASYEALMTEGGRELPY